MKTNLISSGFNFYPGSFRVKGPDDPVTEEEFEKNIQKPLAYDVELCYNNGKVKTKTYTSKEEADGAYSRALQDKNILTIIIRSKKGV